MWILVLTLFLSGVPYDTYVQTNGFKFHDKEACEIVRAEEQVKIDQFLKDHPASPELGVATGVVTCEPAPVETTLPDPRGHS